jgi:outer membrane protein insertion porin family
MSKLIQIFILIFLGMGITNASANSFAEKVFPQNSKEEIKSLVTKFSFLNERSPSESEVDLIIRFLVLQLNYESAIAQTNENNEIVFSVQRTEKLAKLEIKGNDDLSESEIRLILGLNEKSIWDPDALIEGAQRLKNVYQERGFYNVQIDLELEKSNRTEKTAKILITEGKLTRVDQFVINTPHSELTKKIEKHLKKFRKEAMTDSTLADIRSSMREFLSENGYFKSEINEARIELKSDQSKAVIHLTINNGDFYQFDFKGQKNIPSSELKKSLNLDTFFSSNPVLAPEFANKIKDYYLSKGYARAEIAGQELAGSRPFYKNIELNINEGPRVAIEDWKLNGRFSQKDAVYIDFIKQHSGPQIKKKWYVREELETGIKNLIVDRQNNGFLKAKLVSLRTTYNSSKDKISVGLNFDEGPLTLVEKITFENAPSYPAIVLAPIIGLETNQALRLNQLELGIQKLKEFYRSQGYLEMSILNEKEDLVRYNEDNTLAQLHFKIYEGPQIRVASIQIEGNVLTKEYVILKELEFAEGDVLTPAKIEESTSRLQKLGHFNSIDIRTLEENTQVANRTIIIRVVDRDPGLFNMGLGATNERGITVRGYLGLAYRNIGGTGRGLSARIDGNYNITDIRYLERKVSVGYLEPYIFDTRTRGRMNHTQSISVTNYSPVLLSEIRQTTATLEQDLTSNILVSWDVLSRATYRDFSRDFEANYPEQTLDIASTALTFDVDFRDHSFNPTSGTFTRFNSEYGAPELGSNKFIKYLRSLLSFTHYWSLSPGWVWANSARAGYLKNLLPPDEGRVPYDKKGFSLGGQSTVRGFTPGEYFPSFFEFGTDRYEMTTESTMQLVKSELRIPIWGNIGTAIFYDGGQITVKDVDIRNPWRHAVGIAARYMTPVGAASLELGYKLNPQAYRNESMAAVHFSIGTF